MPDRKRIEDFIATVISGDHVRAIADFYHEDASMQENTLPPRQGKQHLLEHEEQALARIKSMDTLPVETFLVDGDNVVIRWSFIMTDMKGVKRRLNEVSIQKWNGGLILTEQFIYDTATAWQVVE